MLALMAPRPPPLAALGAGRGLLYFYDLDALGFTLDRLVGPLEDRVVPLADPILGLDHAYLALKDSTGLPLERAGQAVALLKQLGLPDMARRFSRLTTRRRGAAHPDACFVHELRAALASVDGQLLQGVTKTFGGGFGGRSSSTDVDGSDAGTASVEHSSVGTPSDYVRDKNQHVLSSGLAHPASDLPPTGGAITKDAGKTLTSDHEASDFRDLIKGDLEPPASCSSALSDEAVGTRHLVPLPGGGMQTHVGLLTGKACALDVATSDSVDHAEAEIQEGESVHRVVLSLHRGMQISVKMLTGKDTTLDVVASDNFDHADDMSQDKNARRIVLPPGGGCLKLVVMLTGASRDFQKPATDRSVDDAATDGDASSAGVAQGDIQRPTTDRSVGDAVLEGVAASVGLTQGDIQKPTTDDLVGDVASDGDATSAGQAQGDIRLLATDQPVDTKGLAVHQNSQDMPSLEQTLAPCTEVSHRSGNVRGKTSHLYLRRIDKQIMKNTRDAERISQRLKQASGLSQEHIAYLLKERASSLKAITVLQATRSAVLEHPGNDGHRS